MEIHYKKLMGSFYLIIGVIFTSIAGLALLNGGNVLTFLVSGLALIFIGSRFLKMVFFVVNEDCIVLHSLLGPTKTTFSFRSLKELEIIKNKVYINQNGKRQPTYISAWMSDKNDWQIFMDMIDDAA